MTKTKRHFSQKPMTNTKSKLAVKINTAIDIEHACEANICSYEYVFRLIFVTWFKVVHGE